MAVSHSLLVTKRAAANHASPQPLKVNIKTVWPSLNQNVYSRCLTPILTPYPATNANAGGPGGQSANSILRLSELRRRLANDHETAGGLTLN